MGRSHKSNLSRSQLFNRKKREKPRSSRNSRDGIVRKNGSHGEKIPSGDAGWERIKKLREKIHREQKRWDNLGKIPSQAPALHETRTREIDLSRDFSRAGNSAPGSSSHCSPFPPPTFQLFLGTSTPRCRIPQEAPAAPFPSRLLPNHRDFSGSFSRLGVKLSQQKRRNEKGQIQKEKSKENKQDLVNIPGCTFLFPGKRRRRLKVTGWPGRDAGGTDPPFPTLGNASLDKPFLVLRLPG